MLAVNVFQWETLSHVPEINISSVFLGGELSFSDIPQNNHLSYYFKDYFKQSSCSQLKITSNNQHAVNLKITSNNHHAVNCIDNFK